MWFAADDIGLFSRNVVSFSHNVVPSAQIFSVDVVPKPPMYSVPALDVIGPLHLAALKLRLRLQSGGERLIDDAVAFS